MDWQELMHRVLDGEALSPPERAAFEAGLADEERRRRYERLKRLGDDLGALPFVKPPASVAHSVAKDVALSKALSDTPVMPRSVAAIVASRVADDAHPEVASALRGLPRVAPPVSVAVAVAKRVHAEASHNPAPLVLVGGLLVAFSLLTLSFAWPNVSVGVTVLQSLLSGLSPLVFVGFALALVASVLTLWRPTPTVRRGGALALASAFALMFAPLGTLFSAGTNGTNVVRVGRDVVVNHAVPGDVVALGGNVVLLPGAKVGGAVVAFLGDVRQRPGAQVAKAPSALLGNVEGARVGLSTKPLPALGTASAFQPLLEWIGAGAWTPLYLAALGAIVLLLFLSGVAERLARRQRHALTRTLALGTLVFGLIVPPLVIGALSGFLVPALVGGVLALLALSVGLAVSLYDGGRAITRALRLPRAEVIGAVLGLALFAATLFVPPLALAVWMLGGLWGAGTLLLARPELRA